MEENSMMKSLRDRAREFKSQLPFMDGRDKGDVKELLGQVSTIQDFGFLHGDDGDYAVFIVKERSNKFYFGGAVLTDQLQQLFSEGYYGEIVANGLPMLLTERRSKTGRGYTGVEFYPEV